MFKLTWCEAFPTDLLNFLQILEFTYGDIEIRMFLLTQYLLMKMLMVEYIVPLTLIFSDTRRC